MIKKLRVTIDGKTYDVAAEIPDESSPKMAPPAPKPAAGIVSTPVALLSFWVARRIVIRHHRKHPHTAPAVPPNQRGKS